MAFSTTSKTFLSQSSAAYDKFKKHQIPFTAAKIYISGSKNAGNKFDDVVGNNFRSEKDVILKSENHYAVLLQNTCLQAAEEVMNRLGTKIHRESGRFGKTKRIEPLNVSACLYGTCEDVGKLNFKYLDLTTTGCDKNKSGKGFADVGAYTKWAEPQLNKEYKSVSVLA